MTKQEAIKKAMEARPNLIVESVKELDKCFVVVMAPARNLPPLAFIGGATRVDKKTGQISLYNPLFER